MALNIEDMKKTLGSMAEEAWIKYYKLELESEYNNRTGFYRDIVKMMDRSVKEAVYQVYKPKEYHRRKKHGGLQDPNNFQIDLAFSGDEVVIKVLDIAPYPPGADKKGAIDKSGNEMSLDQYIIRGRGYPWQARDFYDYFDTLYEDYNMSFNDAIEERAYKKYRKMIINEVVNNFANYCIEKLR